MDFDYNKLGQHLYMVRRQQNLHQKDIEERSNYSLRQPAISDIEHGKTRVSVDTLVDYCNALGIRTDLILDPFLTTVKDCERDDVIADPVLIQIGQILQDCPSEAKLLILQIAGLIRDSYKTLNDENRELKAFYENYREDY